MPTSRSRQAASRASLEAKRFTNRPRQCEMRSGDKQRDDLAGLPQRARRRAGQAAAWFRKPFIGHRQHGRQATAAIPAPSPKQQQGRALICRGKQRRSKSADAGRQAAGAYATLSVCMKTATGRRGGLLQLPAPAALPEPPARHRRRRGRQDHRQRADAEAAAAVAPDLTRRSPRVLPRRGSRREAARRPAQAADPIAAPAHPAPERRRRPGSRRARRYTRHSGAATPTTAPASDC